MASEALVGESEVVFQCGVAASDTFDEDDPEHCDHEPEPVDLDEPVSLDSHGRLHFSGLPRECPQWGTPNEFEINGIRVFFE